MISRIVALIILVTPAFADPIPPPALIENIGPARVLTVDLTSNPDEATRSRLWQLLETESKASGISIERRHEITLAKALIELARGHHMAAADLLEPVLSSRLLRDAALFYRAQALRMRGDQLALDGKKGRGLLVCKEATKLLRELRETPISAFGDASPEELAKAELCQARNLLDQARYEPALPFIEKLIRGESKLGDREREWLWSAWAQCLQKAGALEDARRVAEEGSSKFPGNASLKELLRTLPPLHIEEAKNPLRQRDFPEPKKRPQPEEELLQTALALHSKEKTQKALETMAELYRLYPGSLAAQRASARLQSMVLAILERKRPPSLDPLATYLPASTLYSLGKGAWEAEFDVPAELLFKRYLDRYPQESQAGNVTYFLGRIEEDRGNWSVAKQHFERVVTAYSSSPFYERSHFKVAWLSYLLKDDLQALKWFSYDRTLTSDPNDKAQDLYWMAKTSERLGKKSEAEGFLDEIGRIAPLSYYSFLANRLPSFGEVENPPTAVRGAWNGIRIQKAQALLAAGLPKQAGPLLKTVELEKDPQVSQHVALLMKAARLYAPAIGIASHLIHRSPAGPVSKRMAEIYFPVDFETVVRAEATVNALDPMLLFAVIKRESAYQEDAESRAGALGLMQIMPQTAREIVQGTEEPVPERGDLLLSHRNVKLGARYLANQLKMYSGNLAFALAAYNAGPTRTDQWVKRWGSLPVEEFIELIPFEETRNYVKAIIRNYVYYAQLLENRKVELQKLTSLISK